MARTNIDIDDEACAVVMERYRLRPSVTRSTSPCGPSPPSPSSLDEARRLAGRDGTVTSTSCGRDRDRMILIDTSAWVEFLRDTGSPSCDRVDGCSAGIAICDPVRMEVLAGARNDEHLADLRGLLARVDGRRPSPSTTRAPPRSTAAAGAAARRCGG